MFKKIQYLDDNGNIRWGLTYMYFPVVYSEATAQEKLEISYRKYSMKFIIPFISLHNTTE